MDRAFFELHLDPESLYQSLCRTISDVNVIISTNMDEQMGDVTVYPEKGMYRIFFEFSLSFVLYFFDIFNCLFKLYY